MTAKHNKLQADIREIVAEAPASTKWGVAVLDTKTLKIVAGVNRNMRAEALSISKLATATLVARLVNLGGVALEAPLEIQESDVRTGGYFGGLQGQRVQTLELMQGMLRVSDTTAQRTLTRFMGGPNACNRVLETQRLETRSGHRTPPLKVTKFVPVPGEQGAAAKFYTGYSTPAEATSLLGLALDSSINRKALEQNIFGCGLTRNFPASPNMMGIDEDQRHDVAQIGDLIVASFATGYDPSLSENSLHPAHDIQAMLGQVVFDHA